MRVAALAVVVSAVFWLGVLVFLGACAQQPRESGYRDVSGQDRGQAELDADTAACDWEMAKLKSGPTVPMRSGGGPGVDNAFGAIMSAPPPGARRSCMAARGWQHVYTR